MPTPDERKADRRQVKLDEVDRQVREGWLTVRKMTDEERAKYPPQPPRPKRSGAQAGDRGRAGAPADGLSSQGTRTTCPGCGLSLPVHTGPDARLRRRLARVLASVRAGSRPTRSPAARARCCAGWWSTRTPRSIPACRSRRSIQSVAVHLMGLCVLVERGADARQPVPVPGADAAPAGRASSAGWSRRTSPAR